jgi:hypothetical protein
MKHEFVRVGAEVLRKAFPCMSVDTRFYSLPLPDRP